MCFGGNTSAPAAAPPPPPTRLAEVSGGQRAPTMKKRPKRSLRTVRAATPQSTVVVGSGVSGSPTLT